MAPQVVMQNRVNDLTEVDLCTLSSCICLGRLQHSRQTQAVVIKGIADAEWINCTEAHVQRFTWPAKFSPLILKMSQHRTYLLPLRQSKTCSSAGDQTLVIAETPLTSLGLHVSH